MNAEIVDVTTHIERECADRRLHRNDIAQSYWFAIRSDQQKTQSVDWTRINEAILNRWSMHALEWIKTRAWSGRCFQKSEMARQQADTDDAAQEKTK